MPFEGRELSRSLVVSLQVLFVCGFCLLGVCFCLFLGWAVGGGGLHTRNRWVANLHY